jgi:PIN domain nuclease of toxin-antitoxin system
MILLDTHAAIWLFMSPERLSSRAREAILQARITGEGLACSPVSIYQIANSVRIGRLELYIALKDFIGTIETKVKLVTVTPEIAMCAGSLPEPFHGDPMDRIIAATAIVEQLTLITKDHLIRESNVCKCLR